MKVIPKIYDLCRPLRPADRSSTGRPVRGGPTRPRRPRAESRHLSATRGVGRLCFFFRVRVRAASPRFSASSGPGRAGGRRSIDFFGQSPSRSDFDWLRSVGCAVAGVGLGFVSGPSRMRRVRTLKKRQSLPTPLGRVASGLCPRPRARGSAPDRSAGR